MSDRFHIRNAGGTWVVRAAGAVIAESKDALELDETGYDPVIYFPRADIAMPFLDRTEKTTACPHKGRARYYNVGGKSGTITDAAWSYEDTTDTAARIRDHIAFQHDMVTVERL